MTRWIDKKLHRFHVVALTTMLLLITVVGLAACDSNVAADGYKFEKGELVLKPQIVVVQHLSLADLRLAYGTLSGVKPDVGGVVELQAFSHITPDRTVCTIHVVAPQVKYAPETYGHELMHCLYGEWHPEQTEQRNKLAS